MKNKTICTLLVVSIALVIVVSGIAVSTNARASDSAISISSSSSTIYVPDVYSTIQEAVDKVSAGGTVIVREDTYTENVHVNKRLTIKSEKGADKTIVHAFEVTSDYVEIIGFTVKGSSGEGIYLMNADHCNISDNVVLGYYKGINLNSSSKNNITNNNVSGHHGIYLSSSSNNNTLLNNIASNNRNQGITIEFSSENRIIDNNASNNWIGIMLEDSISNNILINNVWSNAYGIFMRRSNNTRLTNNTVNKSGMDGMNLGYSSSNNITNNICLNNNFKDIRLICSSHNNLTNNRGNIFLLISSHNNLTDNRAGGRDLGIYLGASSNYNTLINNTVSGTIDGIYLNASSNYNNLTNNIALSNTFGILLFSSRNNTLTNNTLAENSYGIYLDSSGNNSLTINNVSDNKYGITLLALSNNNTITKNIINSNKYHGFQLRSLSNDVTGNNASNNGWGGIVLAYSSNNSITNNTASNNLRGIGISYCANNTVTGNIALDNTDTGIYLESSNNNTIYNNYFNNTNNSYDNGNNTWNITKTRGMNIVDGPYRGGNYWSDYNGTDLDGDLLGDTLLPYNCSGRIRNGGDWHPLIIIPKIILKASKDGYASVQHEVDNDENFERIEISGIVYDKKTGELIEGAKVELIKGANHAVTTTNVYGNYSITAIIPDGSGSDTSEDVHFELPPAEFIVGVYEITSGVLDLIENNNGTVIDQTLNEDWPQALLVNISKEEDIEPFINNVNKSDLVQYVELNDIIKATYIPNDYRYLEQWGPQNIWAAGPPDPSAWDVERGNRSVRIAIVDTGIQYDHPDLQRFNDGTIKYVSGYDYVDIDNDPSPVAPQEDHGTHCAGIATAVMDNYEGIAGIAPNCSLIAERVFGTAFIPVPPSGHWEYRGDYWSIGFGIMDAAYHDADVISMSFAGPNPHWWMGLACRYASYKGCILVAASGNNAHLPGYTGGIAFPAAYPTVIAVGATDRNDGRATFLNLMGNIWGASQWGPELELVAPGVDILSTVFRDGYTTKSGTSMATPHVAGVAALVKSRAERWPPEPLVPNPRYHLNNSQIRQVLIQSATDLGPPGWDRDYGWGKVDAARAIRCVNISGNVREALNNASIPHPPDVPSLPIVNVTSIEGPPGNFTTNENTPLARITKDGDYHVRVPPGVYSICAMAYGYIPSRGLGGERVELPAFDLGGQLNEEHMNFSLDPFRCNVTGIVNDSQTGLLINKSSISLDGPPLITPPYSDVHLTTKTDSNGTYSLLLEYSVHPPYPTGEAVYNITVRKSGYKTQTWNFTLNWSDVVTDYYKCPLDPNDFNPPIVHFSLLSEAGTRDYVIVGAPGERVGDNETQGRAYVFYGSTDMLHHTLSTPNPIAEANFGWSVCTGDVGGDYLEEVIVGAPGEHVGENIAQGRAYVFYGSTDMLRHTLNTSNPIANASFGWSVCTGDVNCDGFDEIIVGAPGERVRDNEAQGRAYVFYGSTGTLRHTLDTPNPISDASFGWSICTGDVNCDGFEEVIVGAPGERVGDNEAQGRAYAFYGSTGTLRYTMDTPNPQPEASFGWSVCTGDVNCDGFEEVIVGAPGERVGDNKAQGRVYVFNGSTGTLRYTMDTPNPQPEASFGWSVCTGDVNCDGFEEIIVGAPGERVGDNKAQGRAYVFYGSTGTLHHTMDTPNPQPEASFGWSVCTGDVNCNGFEEVIVGAPGERVGDNKAQGRAYVFYGSTGTLHHTMDTPNPQPEASFGWSVCTGATSPP